MMQTEHFHAVLAVEFYGSVEYAVLPQIFAPTGDLATSQRPDFAGASFWVSCVLHPRCGLLPILAIGWRRRRNGDFRGR